MKKFGLIILSLIVGFSGVAGAKYEAPEGIRTRSDKISTWQRNELDTNGDGKLSLEEFKEKKQDYSREDRRNVRKAQNEGIYMTPEEQFKAMDVDKDGFVTEDEMATFIRVQRDEYGMYY